MLDFELIIPAFNEEKNLPALVERAKNSALQHGFTPHTFKLVIVNNGSQDNSDNVLNQLKEEFGDWFHTIELKDNQGYGGGIFQGLLKTQALYIGWTHADLQCDIEDAFKAFELIKNKKNILVKGRREQRDYKDQFVSDIYQKLAHWMVGVHCGELNAQPKVFHRELLAEIVMPPSNIAFDLYVLLKAEKAGYQIIEIPVIFSPRTYGVSSWASNFFSRYKTIFEMIRYLFWLRKECKQ